MSDTPRYERIIDATAAVAALVPGVRSVWGLGTGEILLPTGATAKPGAGKTVPAWKGAPSEPFQHVSTFGDFDTTYRTATVTETRWNVGMRLYADAKDELEFRRRIPVLVPAYQVAFSQHLKLLGQLPSGSVSRLTGRFVSDANWAWLEMELLIWERINLDNRA